MVGSPFPFSPLLVVLVSPPCPPLAAHGVRMLLVWASFFYLLLAGEEPVYVVGFNSVVAEVLHVVLVLCMVRRLSSHNLRVL